MAQMIISHHQDAFFRQENGQSVVTVNVFGHTVDNLQNAYRPAPGQPFHSMELCESISGVVIKFLFFHCVTLLYRISP